MIGQPKIHIVDIKNHADFKEVSVLVSMDGVDGVSIKFEDAAKSFPLLSSSDQGKTWLSSHGLNGQSWTGIVRMHKSTEDATLFCYVSLKDGSDVICAILVRSTRNYAKSDFNVSVNPPFVTNKDRCIINIKGPSNSSFSIKFGDKNYIGRTDRRGLSSFKFTPIQIFTQEQLASFTLVKIPISISQDGNKWCDVGSHVHYVPSTLRTLAATNDPQRPGCVILDPIPNPDQALRFVSQSAPCSDLAIVGKMYDPEGNSVNSPLLTHLDEQYKSVGEGYSKKIGTISGSCSLLDHVSMAPAWYDPISQSFDDILPAEETDDRLLNCFAKGAWIAHSLPVSISAASDTAPCELARADQDTVAVVYRTRTSSVGKSQPLAISRGIIYRPPKFVHAIKQSDTSGVASVVIRTEGGQELSFSVPWSSTALANLAAIINADPIIIRNQINTFVYSDRIEIFSDNRFSVFAGQVLGAAGPNAVSVQQFSGASISLTSTNIKDLSSHNIPSSGKLVFLDGPLRGVLFDYAKSAADSVKLKSCPGINRPGGIIITSDIPCVHFAFLSNNVEANTSVNTTALPARRNDLGDLVSCVYPSISSTGRVVCQSQARNADGRDSNHLFLYIGDGDPDAEDAWLQLTTDGDNRNPSICEDRAGNLHLTWNRDVGNGTYIAYSVIGADSSIFISKSIVADFMRSRSNGSPLGLPAKKSVSVFNIDQSTGLVELPHTAVNFSRGVISSISDSFVRREFIGSCPESIALSSEGAAFGNAVGVTWSQISKGDPVETVLLHIENSDTTSRTYTASLNFDGIILAVAGQNVELSDTDRIFSPVGVYFPSRANSVSFTGQQFTLSTDKKTFSYTVSLIPSQSFQLRFIVSAATSDVRLRTGWVKVSDAGAGLAMPRADKVCLDYSPALSKCCAIIPLFSDDSNRIYDGSHKSIGYMVDMNVNISESKSSEQFILSGSMQGLVSSIENNLPTNLGPLIRNTFTGDITYSKTPLLSAGANIALGPNVPGLAGFSNGDRVFVNLIAVPPASGGQISVSFTSPILAIDWERNTVITRHGQLSSQNLPDNSQIGQNNLVYGVSNRGRTLTIQIFPGSSWRLALVYTAPSNALFLENSSDDAVNDAQSDFLSSFTSISNGLYEYENNRMSFGKSKREFSDFIPIISSLRLNDLQQNPSGIIQTTGLGFLAPGGASGFSLSCSDLVGNFYQIPSGATVTRPSADGTDGIIYHYVLGVALESVRLFARNTETKDQFCSRLSSDCPSYFEGISKTLYTGNAKLVAWTISSESTHENDRTPYGIEVTESDKIFDAKNAFRLTCVNYINKDHEHAVRTERLHNDSFRFEGPESSSSLVDRAHRSLLFAYVDGAASLATDSQVDLSDGRRQFDLCFGSFLSAGSWFRHHDFGYRNSLVSNMISVQIDEINISDAKLFSQDGSVFSDNDFEPTQGFSQQQSSFELIRNGSFLESSILPGDWVNMQYLSSAVDEWSSGPSGFIYGGTSLASIVDRALAIQPNSITNDAGFNEDLYSSDAFPANWFWQPRANKIVHGGMASAIQSSVFASSGFYNVQIRVKKLEKSRNDNSIECPFDMQHPIVGFGSDQEAAVSTIVSDTFAPISASLQASTSDFNIFSFHPLYQKRAADVGLTSHICCYVDSTSVFKISNPSTGVTDFLNTIVNQKVLAIVSNSENRFYDNNNGIMIAVVIKTNGNLQGFVRIDRHSSATPNTALENQVQNIFNLLNVSIGSSWRDISIGSTFAIAIRSTGELVFIGVETADSPGISTLPAGKFISVACGKNHALAISENGTLVAWGSNSEGQCDVPPGVFCQISATQNVCRGLRPNGSLLSWGNGAAYSEEYTQVRSISHNCIDFKGIDYQGNLVGIEDPFVDGTNARVGFQGPYTVFLSEPGASPDANAAASYRLLKFYAGSGVVIEVTDMIMDIYKDPFRSNVVVKSASAVSSQFSNDEFSLSSVESMTGFPIATVTRYGTPYTSGGLSISRLGRNIGAQRNPSISVDRLSKIYVSYEDNSDGNWGVFTTSMRNWCRGLLLSDKLSDDKSQAYSPAISVDPQGRVVAAWHERDGLASRVVASALVQRDIDIPDPCLVDASVKFVRNFDSTPYDPYLLPREFSCDISVDVTPATTGTYRFVLELFRTDDNTMVYSSSSALSPDGWFINGNTLSAEGQALVGGVIYKLSYNAVPQSIRNLGVLKWVIRVDPAVDFTAQETVSFVSSKSSNNIQQLSGTNGADIPIILTMLNGNVATASNPNTKMFLIQEQSKPSPINLSKRYANDYISLIDGTSSGNFSLPDGVSFLPGVSVGDSIRSFLLHVPYQVKYNGADIVSPEFVLGTITFSGPIFAIAASPSDLGTTDSPFGYLEVTFQSDGRRAVRFTNGEYMILSANLRTLDFRIKRKDSVGTFSQFRILTSPGRASSISANGYLFCPVDKSYRCAVSASYQASAQSKLVHFRATVYTDSNYQNAIAVYSSKNYPSYWDAGRGIFPSGGVFCAPFSVISCSFIPRIAPVNSVQSAFADIEYGSSVRSGTQISEMNRLSLLPDTTYYVKLESDVDGVISEIPGGRRSFICSSDDLIRVSNRSWQGVDGKRSYISSYDSAARMPSVCATDLGLFYICWQDGSGNKDYNAFGADEYITNARFAMFDMQKLRWSSVDGEGGSRPLYDTGGS